jgi:O-antigen ligase
LSNSFPNEKRHRSRRPSVQERSTGPFLIGFFFSLALLLLPEAKGFAPWSFYLSAVGTLGLLFSLFLAAQIPKLPFRELRYGYILFPLLLTVWTLLIAIMSPFMAFAITEIERIISGTVALLFGIYAIRTRNTITITAVTLSVTVLLLTLIDFGLRSESVGTVSDLWSGVLGTHETTGTFLLLVLPLSGAVAGHSRIPSHWRYSALGVFLLLLVGLVLTQCRSAWIGCAAGIITWVIARFFVLSSSSDGPRFGKQQRWTAFIGILVVSAVVVTALTFTGNLQTIVRRIGSMNSLKDGKAPDEHRLLKWKAAALMLREEPIKGLGLGSYSVLQAQWTHQGADPSEVITGVIRHDNIAHNYYVQWAADTGTIGIFLYIAAVLSVAVALGLGFPQIRNTPLTQAIILGCLVSIVSGAIDALFSPSYNFPGLYTLYWTIAGLGIGAIRFSAAQPATFRPVSSASPQPSVPPISLKIPFPVQFAIIALSAFFAGGIFVGGVLLNQQSATVPDGRFLLASTAPYTPGNVAWTARYVDRAGQAMATYPGTIWNVIGEENLVPHAFRQSMSEQNEIQSSVIEVQPDTPIFVKAVYRDNWGRLYEATVTYPPPTKTK